MDTVTDQYSRRIGDLIDQVKTITQEVDDYLGGGSRGMAPRFQGSRKAYLMSRQAKALEALNQAIAGQQELLDQLQSTGEPIPKRRASDRDMEVESQDITDIKRRAGMFEDDYMAFDKPAVPSERVFVMIQALAAGAMESGNPFQAAQQIIGLANKVQG